MDAVVARVATTAKSRRWRDGGQGMGPSIKPGQARQRGAGQNGAGFYCPGSFTAHGPWRLKAL